jgi:hypothetical protein
MDIPEFRRGLELNSRELNKLSNAVRSAAVTSVIGGRFTRTPGGTTIIVNDQVRGGGGGGSSIPCPFQVSDATDEEGMKVQIEWGLIWQMLPTGMQPDNDPPLKMTITATGYVYSKIVFNKDTLIPTSVSFSIETEIKSNSDTTQYNLIAIVTVDTTTQPASITGIQNICIQPFPSPCALAETSA